MRIYILGEIKLYLYEELGIMVFKKQLFTLLLVASSPLLGMMLPHHKNGTNMGLQPIFKHKNGPIMPSNGMNKDHNTFFNISALPSNGHKTLSAPVLSPENDCFQGLSATPAPGIIIGSPEVAQCQEIKRIAQGSPEEQIAYAKFYCKTPQAQKRLLTDLDYVAHYNPYSYVVLLDMQRAKQLNYSANERQELLDGPKITQLIRQDRVKEQRNEDLFRHISPTYLSADERAFYTMNGREQQLLKKMYQHFNKTGNTEIDLSTSEWETLEAISPKIKAHFRNDEEFFTAHRMPTGEEKFKSLIANTGQGLCLGALLGIPLTVLKQRGVGIKSALCSSETYIDAAKKSAYKTTQKVVRETIAGNDNIIPFQDPVDSAISGLVKVGQTMCQTGVKDMGKNLGAEATGTMINVITQINPTDIIFDPLTSALAAAGVLGGTAYGICNMNTPCETKSISKIN